MKPAIPRGIQNKDMRALAKEAYAHNFKVVLTSGGHIRFTNAAGERHYTSSTPSDTRTVNNARAALRRLGLPPHDHRGKKGKGKG